MHRGDDRDGAGQDGADDLVPVVGQPADEGARVVGVGEGADVPADAEPRAVRQEEDHPRRLRPLRERGTEVGGHRERDRVARLGAVQGDPPDVGDQLGQHGWAVRCVGHRRPLASVP
jgi:hypothetical protein